MPPTSGTRTSTVALNSSREPVPDFAGASTAVPDSVTGAPGMVPLTVASAWPSRTGLHFSSRWMLRSPRVELRDDAGQPVGAQHLGRDDVDAPVITDDHRIQRRIVSAGIRQSSQPVVFVAECPVDLFDADFVFGGHVE